MIVTPHYQGPVDDVIITSCHLHQDVGHSLGTWCVQPITDLGVLNVSRELFNQTHFVKWPNVSSHTVDSSSTVAYIFRPHLDLDWFSDPGSKLKCLKDNVSHRCVFLVEALSSSVLPPVGHLFASTFFYWSELLIYVNNFVLFGVFRLQDFWSQTTPNGSSETLQQWVSVEHVMDSPGFGPGPY